MSFLDRLRVKTAADGATGIPVDLGDDSPTHYLTDDPEADNPADPWRYGFTRRRFIQAGATAALGCAALANQLTTSRYSFSPLGARAAHAQEGLKTLVVLTFRGGVDGLNVVVPHGDDVYYQGRSGLAIGKGEVLGLDGMFGLNPRMGPLKALYDAGALALVHGCGNTDHHDRSHFSATRRNEAVNGVGYLDGFMQAQAERTALSSVAVDNKLPGLMSGPVGELALGGGIEDFRLRGPDEDVMAQVISTMYEPQGDMAAQQVASTMSALDTAKMLADAGYEPANGANYPDGGLGKRLREVARLIKAGVGLQCASVEIGGFDTHTNQRGDLDNHCEEIANGLAAFATDLGPALNDVVLVTASEFGRRIEQNNNAGTDHGKGNMMMVLGGGVNGGQVIAEDWDLSRDERGDVRTTIDYRSVLTEAMTATGGSAEGVFPGFAAQPVGLF
jgi:uncharacterized protein (DUF1501 family)